MNRDSQPPRIRGEHSQSTGEEIANSITHGIGALLAIAGLVVLVVLAARQGDPWSVVSYSIYGATLVILYLASTLYHAFRGERAKRFFHLMDHISIYLLIAGTYTPLLLVALRGPWGWTLFGVIWGLAVLGTLFKVFFIGRLPAVSLAIYLAMGWLVVIAFRPMLEVMSTGLLIWIAVGGACYTLGALFYAWRGFPYHHMVWHLFVLAGSASHFFGFLLHLPGS